MIDMARVRIPLRGRNPAVDDLVRVLEIHFFEKYEVSRESRWTGSGQHDEPGVQVKRKNGSYIVTVTRRGHALDVRGGDDLLAWLLFWRDREQSSWDDIGEEVTRFLEQEYGRRE